MNPAPKFLGLLLLLLGTLMAGCSMQNTKDSSVPWAQPAGWEGQVPGMGSAGSNGMGH